MLKFSKPYRLSCWGARSSICLNQWRAFITYIAYRDTNPTNRMNRRCEGAVIIVKTKKKYVVGGNRWMLADRIERGEPAIILIVDFPQQIEIGDHFLAELDMLQKEIAEIAESFRNHQ